ncbi:MAG: D-galactosyl-beta-1-4-L-rhamnose phosphorylase, partial [Lachnospiraceae bacterium]|nr:D-galactosyl-beta-1-4-L-rhamnose phosphorylase [Lachnospiraceae bacterium]
VKNGALSDVDVVINAGYAGSAWSGGDAWKDDELVTALTKWVYEGGTFLGVNEPSAVAGYDNYFRMAHVLGIDEDTGAKVCHGKWSFEAEDAENILPQGATVAAKDNRFLTDGKASVLMADEENRPQVTMNKFGKGLGIYLSSFEVDLENTRMLYQLIRYAGGEGLTGLYMTDNLYTECAYYPESKKLVVINNSDVEQTTTVKTESGDVTVTIDAYDTVIQNL